jgi:hypothetical protein
LFCQISRSNILFHEGSVNLHLGCLMISRIPEIKILPMKQKYLGVTSV